MFTPPVCDSHQLQVHQGDWFGGKAVGMVILEIGRLKAHVYLTHVSPFFTSPPILSPLLLSCPEPSPCLLTSPLSSLSSLTSPPLYQPLISSPLFSPSPPPLLAAVICVCVLCSSMQRPAGRGSECVFCVAPCRVQQGEGLLPPSQSGPGLGAAALHQVCLKEGRRL